jgi:hypothetical protein
MTAHLQAVIFESNTIADILPHIEPDTLVVFDLDDTIFRTPSMLGNDAWFSYQVQQKLAQGKTYNEATQEILPLYLVIQFCAKLELVDPLTPQFITDLHNKDIKIMALSTRSLGLVDYTKKELTRLGVCFSEHNPYQHDLKLGLTHAARYTDGILFGANNKKGELLMQFLDIIAYQPKKIIFVNDKHSHLETVEHQVESRGITFVGLRYSAEDARKAAFDPVVADQLLEEFKRNLAIIPLKR